MDKEELEQLRNEIYEICTKDLKPEKKLFSFNVNTDYLKKQLDEMCPGFEVEINSDDNKIEITFKKMITTRTIKI